MLLSESLIMPAPAILYLHGFNSAPNSSKALQLKQAWQQLGLAEQDLIIPQLPHRPAEAIALLEPIIARQKNLVLVGSSLGGYYSTYLANRHQLPALLINPAVMPHKLFDGILGEQENLYTGERWQLTMQHINQLAALEVPAPAADANVQVYLQSGDETLDYRHAQRYYAASQVHVEQGGNHGYANFARRLPDILLFAGVPAERLAQLDLTKIDGGQ